MTVEVHVVKAILILIVKYNAFLVVMYVVVMCYDFAKNTCSRAILKIEKFKAAKNQLLAREQLLIGLFFLKQ